MSHCVVKIGGCNGSGKTSVVRAILDLYDFKPKYDLKPSKPSAYVAKAKAGGFGDEYKLVVLGSYENVCGGMDTISDKEDRLALVRHYAKKGNIVIYEGLITGKTYGAMGAFSQKPSQFGRWLYTFMDTPFETCVARVLERRQAAGNDAPFDPERTMRPTYGSCERLPDKVRLYGHPQPLILNHKHKPAALAAKVLSKAEALFYA